MDQLSASDLDLVWDSDMGITVIPILIMDIRIIQLILPILLILIPITLTRHRISNRHLLLHRERNSNHPNPINIIIIRQIITTTIIITSLPNPTKKKYGLLRIGNRLTKVGFGSKGIGRKLQFLINNKQESPSMKDFSLSGLPRNLFGNIAHIGKSLYHVWNCRLYRTQESISNYLKRTYDTRISDL
jgi:hypothetical protein